MATGTQVPWTTPGGTPCCCEDPVNDCITPSSSPSFSSIGRWREITDQQYALFFAGGSWSVSANASLSFDAIIDDDNGTDPWTGFSNGSGSTTLTDIGGCDILIGNNSFGSGTGGSDWLTFASFPWSFSVGLRRRLGTDGGKRYISLLGTTLNLNNPMEKSVVCSVAVPSSMGYTGTRPLPRQLSNPLNYVSTISFAYAGQTQTYTNTELSVKIQTAGTEYPYSYSRPGPNTNPNGDGMINISETGTISLSISFSPSAP